MYTTTFLQCHQTTISAVGATTTILSDQWGNRLSIDDPDAGTHTYDNYGQLQTLTYPDGFKISYSYTDAGKLKEIRRIDDNNSNTLIYKVTLRNKYNQTTGCEYGNEVVTKYEYNPYGLLTRIQTGKLHTSFYGGGEEPQPKGGIDTLLVSWLDSAILNYRYAYDDKGLMCSRSESVMNRLETYQYDKLDRLKTVTAGKIGETGTVQTLKYYGNGNIQENSKVGIYKYGTHLAPSTSPQPHAVTQIDPINNNVISANQCDVAYNFFNQPTQITEGTYKLNLFYNANQQRNKAIKYKEMNNNYVVENTRFYVNKHYEKEIDSANVTRHYHYIYGDNGVVALHIKKQSAAGTTDSMYYVHTDHLGSYCAITNPSKKLAQRNYFDPWGNMPKLFFGHYQRGDTLIIGEAYLEGDSISMSEIPNLNFSLTNRGFTGHEHYPYFKIINMNGRLYDPVIARFFSPDKYVANSSFTQDYNRYTYARNNPLMYTDPDGEFVWFAPLIAIAVSAAISATSHVIQVACSPGGFQNWNTMNFVASTFMGAWSGAATAGIGGAIGGVSMSTGMGLLKELGRAGAHATVSGLTSMAGGGSFWTGAATGAISSFAGSLTSNFSIATQIGVSTITGGITSKISGGEFWKGAVTGFTISAFNHAMDEILQQVQQKSLEQQLADKLKSTPVGSSISGKELNFLDKKAGLAIKEIVRVSDTKFEVRRTLAGTALINSNAYIEILPNQSISGQYFDRGNKTFTGMLITTHNIPAIHVGNNEFNSFIINGNYGFYRVDSSRISSFYLLPD
jgi:RHS repeat-associated protein